MVPVSFAIFLTYTYKENNPLADKTCMIIQASHMNHSFMQKLQTQKNQGENLGSSGLRLGTSLHINSAKLGQTPAAEALAKAPAQQGKLPEKAPESLGATFANEIIRRMGEELDTEGQPKDVTALRHSLGSTMDWLRERFGDETAAAAAGMILQSTSSGVSEESLGDGLLNTLKFIDRNFGFAAGDSAIATFNSGVNSELNNYFDNGKSEIFFASDSVPDAGEPSATQDINVRFFMRAVQAGAADGKDETDLTEQILESLKVELDKVAELQNLATQLEADFNPARTTPEAAAAAYESAPAFAGPQFTDIAV